MAKLKKLPASIGDFRNKLGLNQSQFWTRYGVTQSGGSRYESGRNIPAPLELLLRLHLGGVISDADLKAAAQK
jgi:DNA-binding transcriptional regulator YiaG